MSACGDECMRVEVLCRARCVASGVGVRGVSPRRCPRRACVGVAGAQQALTTAAALGVALITVAGESSTRRKRTSTMHGGERRRACFHGVGARARCRAGEGSAGEGVRRAGRPRARGWSWRRGAWMARNAGACGARAARRAGRGMRVEGRRGGRGGEASGSVTRGGARASDGGARGARRERGGGRGRSGGTMAARRASARVF